MANAQALVEDENGRQDHDYSEDASGAKPLPGEFEGKGELAERKSDENSSVTSGRHVKTQQKPDGQKQPENVEREKHVASKRKESEKAFNSNRLRSTTSNT